MNTIGYLLIMVAVILGRAVQRGRAANLPEDIQDTFVAVLTGDAAKLKEVAARRGDGLNAVTPDVASAEAGSAAVGAGDGAALLARMRALGGVAKGYSFGATGPEYYDCSGLVWRAGRDVGMYTGPRFTTTTFPAVASSFAVEVSDGAIGDIVLWPRKHMAVVSGPNQCYGAQSKKTGIKDTTIDGHGGNPVYYRLKP